MVPLPAHARGLSIPPAPKAGVQPHPAVWRRDRGTFRGDLHQDSPHLRLQLSWALLSILSSSLWLSGSPCGSHVCGPLTASAWNCTEQLGGLTPERVQAGLGMDQHVPATTIPFLAFLTAPWIASKDKGALAQPDLPQLVWVCCQGQLSRKELSLGVQGLTFFPAGI